MSIFVLSISVYNTYKNRFEPGFFEITDTTKKMEDKLNKWLKKTCTEWEAKLENRVEFSLDQSQMLKNIRSALVSIEYVQVDVNVEGRLT